MLKKRLIPCLDIKDGLVVKGVRFRNHEVMGDAFELALKYDREGADELVFYDITASPDNRVVSKKWIEKMAAILSIPFSVAGGIKSLDDASVLLDSGAEKVSVNSFALENPQLIDQLAKKFGSQAVVVGIDSKDSFVHQYTGDPTKNVKLPLKTLDWVREVIDRGGGEIVLNSMNSDGTKQGYNISEISRVSEVCTCPLIASGGAGHPQDFLDVFKIKMVTGALAASIFHKNIWPLPKLRKKLLNEGINLRRLF